MANLIIKPSAGGDLKLQDEGSTDAITISTTGNTTLAGTANNLGTATAGVLSAGVTGGSGLDGGKVGSSAFLATHASSTWYNGVATNTLITFNDVTGGSCFNIGSHYSTVNSRYDVPATGLYWFSFTMYTAMDDVKNAFKIRVDNADIVHADASAGLMAHNEEGAGDKTLAFSTLLSLTSGQYVDVRANTGSDWYSGHSFFTGMRIT